MSQAVGKREIREVENIRVASLCEVDERGRERNEHKKSGTQSSDNIRTGRN